MNKYAGLVKLAQLNRADYATYQPMKGYNPQQQQQSQDFNEKHPWLRLGGAFIPGVSTAWDLKDMASNIGKGNYWSALGNAGMAVAGLIPGASLLTGAARLGRAGIAARAGIQGAKAIAGTGKAMTPAMSGAASALKNPWLYKAQAGVNKAFGRAAPSMQAKYPNWLLNSAPVKAITAPRAQALEGMTKYVGWAGKPAVAVPALVAGVGAPLLEKEQPQMNQGSPGLGSMKMNAAGAKSVSWSGTGFGLDSSDILSLRVKMSHCDKTAQCDKMSQDSGFGVAYKAPNMVSLGDIYDAIEGDRSMTSIERQLLVKAIKDATGNASESSRVSSLMSGAVGAILGQLVAKYFGGGVIGRALGAALGFGAGRSLYGAMTKKDPLPGYRVLA